MSIILQGPATPAIEEAIETPTEMSIAIYQRIGFQEYCKLLHYQWAPDQ